MTLVICYSDIAAGEILVCLGSINGPILARFPRSAEGHRAAKEYCQRCQR